MRLQPVFADAGLDIERHAEVERIAHGLRDERPDGHDLDSRPADDTGVSVANAGDGVNTCVDC
jgi:hypothetical protein